MHFKKRTFKLARCSYLLYAWYHLALSAWTNLLGILFLLPVQTEQYTFLSQIWWFAMLKVKVTQSCPTLSDSTDCTVHGILQARILEWVAVSFTRGIFPIQGSHPGLPRCRWILYQLSHKGTLGTLERVAYPSPADLPHPGIELGSPALQADSSPTELSGKIVEEHRGF